LGSKVCRSSTFQIAGDDQNDGVTRATPVLSWKRLKELCKGGQAIFLLEGEPTLVRLKQEIDQKK
jgi:hypothetical protein